MSQTTEQRPRTDGPAPATGHLITPQGRTTIADSVVAKIAGIAAREVSGVHDMGKGAARVLGAVKERLPVGSSSPSVTQGVNVQVGEEEAAVDVDLVCEYGVSIVDVAEAVRGNVIRRIEGMCGLGVTEVNITVDDVWMGDDDDSDSAGPGQ